MSRIRHLAYLAVLTPVCLMAFCVAGVLGNSVHASATKPAVPVAVHYLPPPTLPGASPRTSEGVETAILERLREDEKLPLQPVSLPPVQAGNVLRAKGVELALIAVPENTGIAWQGARVVPLAYRFGAMAIMRSDTDIQTWDDLRGRTVCLSEGGWFTGTITSRFGAIEIVHKAPADALIALRVGECDATVHDSWLLEELLEFPEWQKFSARLPVIDQRVLAFLVAEQPSKAYDLARRAARQWRGAEFQKLVRKMAHNIAFEVYLDQDVPDCH